MSSTEIVVLVLLVAGVSNALFLFFCLIKVVRRNRRAQESQREPALQGQAADKPIV